MTVGLHALCFDAHDPAGLAGFWAGILDWTLSEDHHDGVVLLPKDDTGFRIRFVASREVRAGRNGMHLDLTSTSPGDQQQTVERSLHLGARHLDVGQLPAEGHVVLADPEGNEFCVVEPGNDFLADCGLVGALACDGSQEVGYFWSRALDWPLVWDQDQETAIRSPHGGPKITWGGPPPMPTAGRSRLRFELAALAHSDHRAEEKRLLSLGATPIGTDHGEVDWTVLGDPDGNEFWLSTRQRG